MKFVSLKTLHTWGLTSASEPNWCVAEEGEILRNNRRAGANQNPLDFPLRNTIIQYLLG